MIEDYITFLENVKQKLQIIQKYMPEILSEMYAELATRTGEDEHIVRARIAYIAHWTRREEQFVLEDVLMYHRIDPVKLIREEDQ